MNTSTNNQANPEALIDHEADVSLIQQVLDGNINAYESIMRRHNQRLFRLARSIGRVGRGNFPLSLSQNRT